MLYVLVLCRLSCFTLHLNKLLVNTNNIMVTCVQIAVSLFLVLTWLYYCVHGTIIAVLYIYQHNGHGI